MFKFISLNETTLWADDHRDELLSPLLTLNSQKYAMTNLQVTFSSQVDCGANYSSKSALHDSPSYSLVLCSQKFCFDKLTSPWRLVSLPIDRERGREGRNLNGTRPFASDSDSAAS